MSDIKYLATLPTPPYRVNKLKIKGTLVPNAEQFSINFVNDTTCYAQQNITYHYKQVLNTSPQKIVENFKRDGSWSLDHKERELDAFDGLFNQGIQSAVADLSSTGTVFYLEFTFDYPENKIHVYNIRGEGYNFLSSFEATFELTDIEALQVWGDVQKIHEFSLHYD